MSRSYEIGFWHGASDTVGYQPAQRKVGSKSREQYDLGFAAGVRVWMRKSVHYAPAGRRQNQGKERS